MTTIGVVRLITTVFFETTNIITSTLFLNAMFFVAGASNGINYHSSQQSAWWRIVLLGQFLFEPWRDRPYTYAETFGQFLFRAVGAFEQIKSFYGMCVWICYGHDHIISHGENLPQYSIHVDKVWKNTMLNSHHGILYGHARNKICFRGNRKQSICRSLEWIVYLLRLTVSK